MRAAVPGFDYLTGKAVALPVRAWGLIARNAIAAGGRRRFADGETFIHAKGGKITHEIYRNVQPAKPADDAR